MCILIVIICVFNAIVMETIHNYTTYMSLKHDHLKLYTCTFHVFNVICRLYAQLLNKIEQIL